MSPPQNVLDVDEMEPTAAYAHAILTALANTLSTKISKPRPDSDVPKYINTLLPHLFRLCLEAAVETDQRVFADVRLLRVVARIVRLVLEASSAECAVSPIILFSPHIHKWRSRLQRKFLGALADAYLNGQVRSVTGGEFASTETFRPMDVCFFMPLLGNGPFMVLVNRQGQVLDSEIQYSSMPQRMFLREKMYVEFHYHSLA